MLGRRPSRWTLIALSLTVAWYLLATLPYLADYPLVDWPQMGIAAPAHKLATEGVYGNDLFTGFYRTELRNYEYMPAYPILVALSFEIFGLGIWQARIVSVTCGLLAVLLTFRLGRQLAGTTVGVLAAVALSVVRPGGEPGTSGITLIDVSRGIRYDILVPVFVLGAASAFIWSLDKLSNQSGRQPARASWGLFATGVLAGLATLSHLYGGFILVVVFLSLSCEWRAGTIVRPPWHLIVAGVVVALLPWATYVIQDLEAYRGQMARHEGRFDLLDPLFYVRNLAREYHRYGAWAQGFPSGLLVPRIGIWIVLLGVPASLVLLWRRVRSTGDYRERFLLLAFPTLAALLALLVNLKRHVYLVLLLPFIALQLGMLARHAWDWTGHHRHGKTGRTILLGIAFLCVVEGAVGVTRMLDRAGNATPYTEVTAAIAQHLPPGSRALISQPFWLGLADYETRSLNLPFVMSSSIPIEATLDSIGADYVVVERAFFEPGTSGAHALWQRVKRYLETHCALAGTVDGGAYGTIEVHECRHDGGRRAGADRQDA